MGPTTVTGADAVRAWRALTAEQRTAAWAAAKVGAAPPDGALAAVMAGYGLRRQRQLRFAPVVIALLYLTVFCGSLVALTAGGGAGDGVLAGFVGFSMAILIAVLIVNSILRIRVSRLAAAGALGLEAAYRGAVPAGVPAPLASAGDFTVPFGVRPAPSAPFAGVALPVAPNAAGVVELPAQRGRIALAIALMSTVLIVVLLGLTAMFLESIAGAPDPVEWVFIVIEGAAFLTLLGTIGLLIVLLLPALRSPVTARFTPQGWELPPAMLRGPWSEVQAIEVRAFSAGGGGYGRRSVTGTRIVVFRLPQPERYIAGHSPIRRWALRRSMRRYGSPVLLATGPRSPVNLEQLLATLARFTAAPVHWT